MKTKSVPAMKPRGFFKNEYLWTNDTATEYYEGARLKIYWPLFKLCIVLCILFSLYTMMGLGIYQSLLICLMVTSFYQDIVAMIVPNTIRIPPMDQQTFLSGPNTISNVANCSMQDKKCVDAAYKNFDRMFEILPKMRYKIKEICGDYYYEEMTKGEATLKAFIEPKPDKVLRSQDDVDAYIRDNLNEKMPLDGPQWQMYVQDYNPIDQDHLPDD